MLRYWIIILLCLNACTSSSYKTHTSYKAKKYNQFVAEAKQITKVTNTDKIVRYALYDENDKPCPYSRIFMAKYDTKISDHAYDKMLAREMKKLKPINNINIYSKSWSEKYNKIVKLYNKLPSTHYKSSPKVSWHEFMHFTNMIEETPMIPPMQNYLTTSRYGIRKHPISKKMKIHTGVDILNTKSDEVISTATGNVIFAGVRSGYGKLVIINHKNYSTRYAHLNKIFVTKGQKIHVGDVIGLQGATGNVTAKHLHYEIRLKEKHIDPANFLKITKECRF